MKILIVLLNNDPISAYYAESLNDSDLNEIRKIIRGHVDKFNSPRQRFDSDLINVRLVTLFVENPICSGNYKDSFINEIVDKISS